MVRVVVGWSGSPHSAAAVMWAARVAERTGRELIVVHVTHPSTRRLRWHAGLSPLSRTLQRAEHALRRDVRRRFRRVRMTILHEVGDTGMGEALRHTPRERAAKASHATWLVVASCPHEPATSRPPRLLGDAPVCHCRDLDLLRSAACPVLIVPETVRRHAPSGAQPAAVTSPAHDDHAESMREGALATVG